MVRQVRAAYANQLRQRRPRPGDKWHLDGLGNVAEVLNSADPSELAALYAALRLEMVYNAAAKIVGVSIRPTGRGSDRVRGGT